MELSPSHETEAPIPRAYIFNPPPPPALHRYCASSNGGRRRARYRECLRNHAAAIGGHALDGCGEFMPGGEEGTPEALRCSACRCHRNFHRREADGGEQQLQLSRVVGQNGVLISAAPPPHHHQMVVPLGAAPHGSEHSDGYPRAVPARRRFRTKFTPEQKERMLEFAERAGWRLPRRQEEEVQRFCMEIGVRRRVLKVWMHNNKHSLARRTSAAIAAAVAAPPPPPPPAAATAAVAPV